MVDKKGYVPVLLTKRGERSAVRDLSPVARRAMTPLFVVEPIPWDYEREEDQKSIDEHLAPKAQDLFDAWGVGPAFIDMPFSDDTLMAGGLHPLVWLTAAARALGLPLVPVVGINRSAAYRAAVTDIAVRDGDGVCIRLPVNEWPSVMQRELDDLLIDLGLGPDEVDLVLDLGEDVGVSLALSERAIRSELNTLPYIHDWRSLIVTGAGLPKTMPAGRGVHVLDRFDWGLYQRLAIHAPPPRMPAYGDYAIAHPDPFLDVNPMFMSLAATLRYTAKDDWLISKGELFKASGGRGIGGAAVPPVAAALVAHPEFMNGHCAGDDWIAAAASGGPTGNSETWRRHGTHHHLELVPAQLATLHGP